jgi:nucleotide-binding universal stress UspA family protein
MLERILVPLDGSELSRRILEPVSRLAKTTNAEVRAISVVEDYAADQAMLRGEDPLGLASAELGRALEPLTKLGLRTAYDSYIGDPATRILEDAEDYRPSLIAMATHGRSGADRWIRGSTAERVLRRSPFPVLLANPRAIDRALPIERILVPLDGSELSARVLPAAVDLARAYGADLILLHVIEGGAPTADASKVLEPFAARLQGVRYRTVVTRGSAAFEILEAAREQHADLVAMATHGRSGPSRWVFGSAAEHVLHQCNAPLLVVRVSGLEEGARSKETAVTRRPLPSASP